MWSHHGELFSTSLGELTCHIPPSTPRPYPSGKVGNQAYIHTHTWTHSPSLSLPPSLGARVFKTGLEVSGGFFFQRKVHFKSTTMTQVSRRSDASNARPERRVSHSNEETFIQITKSFTWGRFIGLWRHFLRQWRGEIIFGGIWIRKFASSTDFVSRLSFSSFVSFEQQTSASKYFYFKTRGRGVKRQRRRRRRRQTTLGLSRRLTVGQKAATQHD